ncbi:MAG: hypothetical protein M1281_14630 [Chloroflexi bacterium]|nr:hypothetical protein [Chloroflexota bacterium]
MNSKERIYNALQEIAREGTRNHTNPWPKLAPQLRKTEKPAAYPNHLLRKVLFILLAVLAAGATAVYAYRIMVDHGLEAADQKGLVVDYNQKALPTEFAAVPTQLRANPKVSQSQNGITVTLDWAYMDEYRLAWQITLSGLSIPKEAELGDFVCRPYITNDQRIPIFNPYIDGSSRSQTEGSIDLVYVTYQHVDAQQVDHLDLHMDLTVGACGPRWNFQEFYAGPGPTPTPPPLIGNYHLSFRVPVNRGMTVSPHQEAESGGIKMRLDTMTFTPSFTVIRLCYRQPSDPKPDKGEEWSFREVELQVDGDEPIHPGGFLPTDQTTEAADEICREVGFAEAIDPVSRITLKVSDLTTTDSFFTLLESPSLQQKVKEALAREGIVIDFEAIEQNRNWGIVQKPAGITDDQVNAKVWDLLTHTIKGNWIFEVDHKP